MKFEQRCDQLPLTVQKLLSVVGIYLCFAKGSVIISFGRAGEGPLSFHITDSYFDFIVPL